MKLPPETYIVLQGLGVLGRSYVGDPRETLDAAADEIAELHKGGIISQVQVLRITDAHECTDVTDAAMAVIEKRMNARAA
jgi:hypothetical protein